MFTRMFQDFEQLCLVNTLGNDVVAFFLDCVPERGEALWLRFKVFQAEHGQDINFYGFVKEVTKAATATLFLPRGCFQNAMIKMALLPAAQQALARSGIRSDSEVIRAHFGDGAAYEAVRNAVCNGCGLNKCPHWKPMQRQQNQRRHDQRRHRGW